MTKSFFFEGRFVAVFVAALLSYSPKHSFGQEENQWATLSYSFSGTYNSSTNPSFQPENLILPKFDQSLGILKDITCRLQANVKQEILLRGRNLSGQDTQLNLEGYLRTFFTTINEETQFPQYPVCYAPASLAYSIQPVTEVISPDDFDSPPKDVLISFDRALDIIGDNNKSFHEKFIATDPENENPFMVKPNQTNFIQQAQQDPGVSFFRVSEFASFSYVLTVTYHYESDLDLKFQDDSVQLTQNAEPVGKLEDSETFNIRLNQPLTIEATLDPVAFDVSDDNRLVQVRIEIDPSLPVYESEPIPLSALSEEQRINIDIPVDTETDLLPITPEMLADEAFTFNLILDPDNTIGEADEENNIVPIVVDEIFEIEDVPLYSQLVGDWADEDLANKAILLKDGTTKKVKISKSGCAVVASSMLLKFYDSDVALDPKQLNLAMANLTKEQTKTGFGGFNAAGDLHFDHIHFVTRPLNLITSWKWVIKGPDRYQSIDFELRNNNPVVLKVETRRKDSSGPGHFVIATGIGRDKNGKRTYSIHDPGRHTMYIKGFLTASPYNGNFYSARLMRKGVDPTSFRISLVGGEVMIIDPTGRRLGRDPSTGELINEIGDNSSYEFLSLDIIAGDGGEDEAAATSRSLHIPNHIPGDYQVLLHAPDGIPASLGVINFDTQDEIIMVYEEDPVIPGEGVLEYNFEFLNESPSPVEGKLEVTHAKIFTPKFRSSKRENDSSDQERDKMILSGSIELGADSDGIDLTEEGMDLILNDDEFARAFAAEDFQRRGKKVFYQEKNRLYEVIVSDSGRLRITARRADLHRIDLSKPVKVSIKIGDDVFEEMVEFEDRLNRKKKKRHSPRFWIRKGRKGK